MFNFLPALLLLLVQGASHSDEGLARADALHFWLVQGVVVAQGQGQQHSIPAPELSAHSSVSVVFSDSLSADRTEVVLSLEGPALACGWGTSVTPRDGPGLG